MSDNHLPPSWTRVKFGDVAKQMKDKVDPETSDLERYVAGGHMDTDDLKIRRWGLVGDGYLGPAFHRKFQKGQILYGSRRTYLRKVAVAEFDGICASTTFVIEARSTKIHPPLLPFIMQSEPFVEHSIKNSRGSTNPYVNWKDIAKYEFALPPLDEQRRIAEILTAVEETIENHKILVQDTKQAKAIQFAHRLHDSNRQHGKLIEFTRLITDGDHNPPKRKNKGIPHVVVKNIDNGRFDLTGCTFISEEDYEQVKKRYLPRKDDIVLTCVGSIGRVAIVPEGFEFSADRSLAIIRTDPKKFLTEFAFELLQNPMMQRRMDALSIGTAQQHLYLRDIRNLQVEIPNIVCQKEILKVLDSFNDCLDLAISHLNLNLKLKKTLVSTLIG